MPIYEFKCASCEEKMEILFKSSDEKVEMKCAKCGSENLERVLSSTNFSMAGGSCSGSETASAKTHSCSGGSCTTYDIPGPTR